MTTTELAEDQLEAVIGPIAMREYQGAPDYDKPKIRQWAASLQTMSDEDFVDACSTAILNSALVLNFKGNWEGDHARASACWPEAKRRHLAAGHTEDCRGDTLYVRGFNRAYRSQGHTPSPPVECDCDMKSGTMGEKAA